MKSYQPGEYIIVQLLASQTKHIQGAISPHHLNQNIKLAELNNFQIVQGQVDSVEQHGYMVKLFGEENLVGFVSKDQGKMHVGKTYIFQVHDLAPEKKLISLRRVIREEEPEVLSTKGI